jgi:hypothetical protein
MVLGGSWFVRSAKIQLASRKRSPEADRWLRAERPSAQERPQIRAVLSKLAVARVLPSGDHATPCTQ